MDNSFNQESQLHYYEDESNDYEAGWIKRKTNRAFKRKSNIIKNAAGTSPDLKILEIGAGSGLLSYFTCSSIKCEKYIVSDLSPVMLKKAEERLTKLKNTKAKEIDFEVIDLYNLEKLNQKFDLIIGTDIIHHLINPELVLRNLQLLLNTSGKVVILETNIYNPLAWFGIIGREHEIRAVLNTPDNFRTWLTKAGWNNFSVKPAPSFTPAGPVILHPLLDLIDKSLVRVPILNKICALWLIEASK
jgi:2-polyprenyl-3-methyl-5-hydroxy-6-metoxy-1,4-benzoquinol methylase